MRGQTKVKSTATMFTEAMHAYEDGRPGEARRLAKRLTDSQPNFGGAHYLLGLLALDQDQGQRAVAHLTRAIAITPGQPPLHLAMARALEQTGDLAEACLHHRTVLELVPTHAEAHARLGSLLGRQGRLDDAIAHCRRAVAANPAHVEAWNTLGALLHQSQEPAEAAQALRQALALRPDWPTALNNYGLVQLALNQPAEAAIVLAGAADLRPDHAGTRVNLAAALRRLERLDEARTQAEAAVRLAPRDGEAWIELGLVRQAQGHGEGAAAAFERATTVMPGQVKPWFCLAEACRAEGDNDRAERAYRHCLTLDGEDQHGAGLGLALTLGESPERAPQAFIRRMYDDYAERFDDSLQQGLGYRGPQILGEILTRRLGEQAALAVLDVGCGTGLAAPVLRPLAARLDGVDLSGEMIERAAARGLYDGLHQGDLVAFLDGHAGQFDLIVAADVLIYLGNLGPVFAAVRHALRAGAGTFAFTVETLADCPSYVLGPKGRYAHGADYVRHQAEMAGFAVTVMEDASIRREAGSDVPGLVVVLDKRIRQRDPAPEPSDAA